MKNHMNKLCQNTKKIKTQNKLIKADIYFAVNLIKS